MTEQRLNTTAVKSTVTYNWKQIGAAWWMKHAAFGICGI